MAVEVGTLVSVDELPGFNTADRDKSARDFLRTHSHPYAVFQPYPQSISADLSNGSAAHARVAGDIEISGVRKPTAFALDVQLKDRRLSAAGNASVAVQNFSVDVPRGAALMNRARPVLSLSRNLGLRPKKISDLHCDPNVVTGRNGGQ